MFTCKIYCFLVLYHETEAGLQNLKQGLLKKTECQLTADEGGGVEESLELVTGS